jgi:hypothetical protein
MRLTFVFSALALIVTMTSAARAATVTLGASRDATMFQNNADNGSGGGNGLFSGTNGAGNSPRRALIGFDVASALPEGSIIQSAGLTLFLGQFPNVAATPTSTIGLRRIVANWGEGNTQQQIPPNDTFGGQGQGAPAVDGDVTWNARFFSTTNPTPWTNPGGDFVNAVSASTVVTRTLNSGYTWSSTDATVEDVQGWLDNPSTNFGWMLVNADEASPATFRGFYSRQTATASLRPQLSLTYVLAGDFDGNDVVDSQDLARWKTGYGAVNATHGQGDANGDGNVNGADFTIWQRQLGRSAAVSAMPTVTATPEPAALALASLAALGIAIMRRW